jgi:Flp pilus assembly protein TadG
LADDVYRETSMIPAAESKTTQMRTEKRIPALRSFASSCRRRSTIRGVALVEFALVFPVVTSLLIGTFWVGRAVSVYQALERAAREGARAAAIAPACASCAAAAVTDSDVDAIVDDVLKAASIDTSNPDPLVTVARNQPLDLSDPAPYGSSAVQVTVSYPIQLSIPFTSLNAKTITLSSSVSMRQEF